jgi:hypothetical protein
MTCLSGKSSQVRNREKETTTRYRLHLQHHPCMHANNVKTSCTTILYNPRNRKKSRKLHFVKNYRETQKPCWKLQRNKKKIRQTPETRGYQHDIAISMPSPLISSIKLFTPTKRISGWKSFDAFPVGSASSLTLISSFDLPGAL